MQQRSSLSNASRSRNIFIGIGFAVLAAMIWSGNFIIARSLNGQIPPFSLNFYRWLIASLIILPFAVKEFGSQWQLVKQSWLYLFLASLTGIVIFNSFVYIGAHYTSAINLALIGTTSSPIMAVVFARIFLKEKIGTMKLAGMILCSLGVVFLLVHGNFRNLLLLHFSTGDLWSLAAACSFALYNTLVKKKPAGITPLNFLFVIFSLGTLILIPFYTWEIYHYPVVAFNTEIIFSIFYIGLGASVICFLIWNKAIGKLGAGRTALFGNLIPVFSSIEAAIILHEKFTWVHITSMAIILAGLVLANRTQRS